MYTSVVCKLCLDLSLKKLQDKIEYYQQCVQASPSPAIQVQWVQQPAPLSKQRIQQLNGVSLHRCEWRTYANKTNKKNENTFTKQIIVIP